MHADADRHVVRAAANAVAAVAEEDDEDGAACGVRTYSSCRSSPDRSLFELLAVAVVVVGAK